MSRRVLLCATTTGYQIRAFDEAAARLGIDVCIASDRCQSLDDPWRDRAIPVHFHDVASSVDAVIAHVASGGLDGVLAVGDRPTVLAASVAARLGLPWHPVVAAERSRQKVLTRRALVAARQPAPAFEVVPSHQSVDEATACAARLLPAVVKPVVLSGSRGVIRANTPTELHAALARLRRLLETREVRAMRDPDSDTIVVEQFIPGREFAIDALLTRGTLQLLALFEKPDPLNGPFFEETIYVSPARISREEHEALMSAVIAAVGALGLEHGPVHAECRLGPTGVTVLEVAARPIGGLCARAIQLVSGTDRCGLEALLLQHAAGESVDGWSPAPEASAVMMMPIPGAGIYRGVDGVEQATAVPRVTAIHITAKADQHLLPLPEGATYLGFVFARGTTADDVEMAVREAHRHLRFHIDRAVPMFGA
jgi:biotin carboxylase